MTLATLTGLFLFGGVATFILVGIIGAAAALGKPQPIMPASGVLTMDMSTIMLTEQTMESDPFTGCLNMEIGASSELRLLKPKSSK